MYHNMSSLKKEFNILFPYKHNIYLFIYWHPRIKIFFDRMNRYISIKSHLFLYFKNTLKNIYFFIYFNFFLNSRCFDVLILKINFLKK
jgi:hypothetical protein